MKFDMVLAGVGGQGVLSVATVIAKAAVSSGLRVRQSEVHGMAQRGGAVVAHLRISDEPILGDLIPKGAADLILSMEPMEALRYTNWLKVDGTIVSASEPFLNIPNYPSLELIHKAIASVKKSTLIEALELAKTAGAAKSVNMVLVGAACKYLPIELEIIEKTISELFAKKDPLIVEANKKALSLGHNFSVATN